MIYADNAATTYFKPEKTIAAVCEYLKHPGNPGRGNNHMAMDAARMVLDTRIKLADLFDCDFDHVVFTSGVTESLNTVIQGLFGPQDHIITTYMEHNSVLRPLYRLGCRLSVCGGSTEEIKKHIRSDTKAVIINHVSNVTGEINDIEGIGKFCRQNGLLSVADTAQSAGVLPVSLKESELDVICFTGHKGLLAMQGIGGICLGEDIDIRPLKVGGSGFASFDTEHPKQYPSALEAGTLNVPGIVSLNRSLDFLKECGIENILRHEQLLAEEFCRILSSFDGVKVYREKEKEYTGIVSLNVEGMDAAAVSDILSREYGIETRAGAHCAPLIHEHYGTESTVRFSFGINNRKEDIRECSEALKEIIKIRGHEA
ncbi:aminotransferase class V-fold PLP-dependent enzyme [Mogibacterium sp. NSJ-24]|jgi:cysteine desulfurase family protein|uniref:Aminotransferase class V-fold PLP-dependent enzyme n=1 Tax=Lentihominibacter hominis TaxID=2763645 RepID=A0A926E7H8_9FIRM|nr:aminotransferase class V-fold PLP-dependent enzyme [Lentihominibacter hominis]MBC8567219.1 aminotransferase class V-fold PLP-dependent enzyme [Lentihominibacter hominis]